MSDKGIKGGHSSGPSLGIDIGHWVPRQPGLSSG